LEDAFIKLSQVPEQVFELVSGQVSNQGELHVN
jgi:hypothetical protein